MNSKVQDAFSGLGLRSQRVTVASGVELNYWDVGEGTTILFVPGWTFTADVFIHQFAGLSGKHRVIAFDPRSQGRSSVTAHGNEYATHAADLKAFIEQLDLRDIVLIGWSAGAAETWGYIRLAGLERVKAHICIDLPPKCLSTNERDDWIEGTLADISGTVMRMSNRKSLRDFVIWYAVNVMIQRTLDQAELDWIVAQSETTPDWAALSLWAYLMFTDFRPEVTLLDQHRPSLFIVAQHWAETALLYVQRTWPNSRVEILGGHMMFWEYPEKFNEIVSEFVASL
jgi:non-heme chloroperoxidase